MKRPVSQPDLFIAALGDVPWRDGVDLMAAPIVSLAKSKRVEPIRFSLGGVEVEVSAPPHVGLATIYDLDVVLWAISQVNAAIRRGETPVSTVRAPAYDILRAIGRDTGGDHYERLKAAIDRLAMTSVRTNQRTPEGKRWAVFHLIESASGAEYRDGRMAAVSVTLPDWIMRAVVDKRIVAVDPRYFEITSGLGRWLYRVARKQAGNNATGWRWTMAELHHRSGVTRPLKKFAFDMRDLIAANAIPEYSFTIYTDTTGGEAVHAVRRSMLAIGEPGHEPRIRRNRLDPA